MAKKEELSGLLHAIRETKQFKVFKKILTTAEGQLDLEQDEKEISALHAARISRMIYGKKQFSNQILMEASMQDLSVRSRIVELRMKAKARISYVEEAVRDMRSFINTEFKSQLSDYKTKEQRTYLTDRILKNALSLISNVEAFTDRCDHYIKDIDQAGFSLSRFSEVLERLHNGKGKVL